MTALHASDWDRDAALTTARILLEIKAVNFRPEEPYTFTSGWKSPVYIDCRKIISFPRARATASGPGASRRSAAHIGYETIDVVAGGETAGIPFAAWIADRMIAPMLYVRKKPKGFGRNAQIEGDVPVGQRTLLVEDLTTDGGIKIRFANALREAGAICDHTFVVFFYGVFPGSFETDGEDGPDPAPPVHLVGRAGGVPRAPVFPRGRADGSAEVPGRPGDLVERAWRRGQRGGRRRKGEGRGAMPACARRAAGCPCAARLRCPAARHADHRHHAVPLHLPPQHREHGGEVLRAGLRAPAAHGLWRRLAPHLPDLRDAALARRTASPNARPHRTASPASASPTACARGCAGAMARPSPPRTSASPGKPGAMPPPASGPPNSTAAPMKLIVDRPAHLHPALRPRDLRIRLHGRFPPLPAHIERARWEADPRTYRTRTAYDTETTNPGLWNGP